MLYTRKAGPGLAMARAKTQQSKKTLLVAPRKTHGRQHRGGGHLASHQALRARHASSPLVANCLASQLRPGCGLSKAPALQRRRQTWTSRPHVPTRRSSVARGAKSERGWVLLWC